MNIVPISRLVREAWVKVMTSPAADRFELLRKTSEWPEDTFRHCERLEPALLAIPSRSP